MPFVGRIYRIWVPGAGVYIGSTKNCLKRRFANHMSDFKRWQNKKQPYCSSFEILAHEDAQIELLHEDDFQDNDELRGLENLWIEKLPTVNKQRALCTREQHLEDNRKWWKEHCIANRTRVLEEGRNKWKKHYIMNRTRILARGSEKIQCSTCGMMIRRNHMSRHRNRKHANINGTD